MGKTILYLVGAGYSGSTLLNRLIGCHPDVISVGEIHHFKKAWLDGQCGCGLLVRNCRFWKDVYKAFCQRFSVSTDFIYSSKCLLYHVPHRKFDTSIHFWKNWPKEQFILQNYLLYEAVFEKTRKSVIVDSSKSAHRAALVAEIGRKFHINVRFIHIIRSAKAVCYSHLRKKRIKREKHVFKPMLIWYLDNRKAEALVKNEWVHKENILHLTYEDLVEKPIVILNYIFSWIGLKQQPDILNDFGECVHHDIGGNPMRFDPEKNKKIVPDDEWMEGLSNLNKLIINAFIGRYENKLRSKCIKV